MTGKKPTKGQSDSHGTVFAASDKKAPATNAHEEATSTASRFRNPPEPPASQSAPKQVFRPAPPGARAQRWSDAPTELRDNPLDDADDPPTLAQPMREPLSEPPTLARPLSEGFSLDEHDLISEDEPRTENTGIEDLPTMDMPIDMEEEVSISSAVFDPKPIGMFGRYQLLGRLAMGGMAEIFLARESADEHMSRFIVIKRIRSTVAEDNEFVSMFLNEARLAMQLKHPTICHLYEFGFEAGHHFLAMEYVDGATLHKIARKAQTIGGIPTAVAVKVVSQVAGALHYAHTAKDNRRQPLNIVHRDVSPHNVMVGYDGVVKLLDFGVAKASTQDVLTMAGVVRGKFAYMSPQQCVGEKLDGRSDIFSLGIVLYEVLTGQRLYRRENQFETMRAVVDDPVPSIRAVNPRLPAELDRIVQKALQKDPNERYPTADLMQQDLEQYLAMRREVVSTARLQNFMEDLFKEEIRRGPELERDVEFETSLPSVKVNAPGGGLRRDTGKTTQKDLKNPAQTTMRMPTQRRRFNADMAWLGVAVAAIVVAAGALFIMRDKGGDVPPGPGGPTTPRVAEPGKPPQAIGRLRVEGPDGSTVFIDGTDQGPAPVTLSNLATGTHMVEVRHPNFEPFTASVTLADATLQHVEAKLKKASGTLVVAGSPAGAAVKVNDRKVCVLPCNTSLDVGKYTLEVAQPGFLPDSQEIEVRKGEQATVTVSLDKFVPRAMGTITVNTQPWSTVFANGKSLGQTPARGRVPAGSVKLVLTDAKGRKVTKTIQVPANKDTTFFFPL